MLSTGAIKVVVNGLPYEVPAGGNVSAVLAHLNIAQDRVAVELNKALVRKRDWDATPVPEGAEIEVVEFVGGG